MGGYPCDSIKERDFFFYHEASSYVKVEKQHPNDAVNNYQHNLAENFKSPSSVQGESFFS